MFHAALKRDALSLAATGATFNLFGQNRFERYRKAEKLVFLLSCIINVSVSARFQKNFFYKTTVPQFIL